MSAYKQIFDKIMTRVPDIINEELGDDIERPKQKMSYKPSYVVECTYIDKTITARLELFGIYIERLKSGVRIYCESWQDVLRSISILEQYKAFEREALNGKEYGTVKIYKWRSSMNDSIIEKINEGRSQKENLHPKGETPRAHAKRDAVRAVRNGEMARDPEVIKQYLLDTGLWEDMSETRLRLDIKFVMDKTEGWDQDIQGDYVTEFTWSQYRGDYNDKMLSEREALKAHI